MEFTLNADIFHTRHTHRAHSFIHSTHSVGAVLAGTAAVESNMKPMADHWQSINWRGLLAFPHERKLLQLNFRHSRNTILATVCLSIGIEMKRSIKIEIRKYLGDQTRARVHTHPKELVCKQSSVIDETNETIGDGYLYWAFDHWVVALSSRSRPLALCCAKSTNSCETDVWQESVRANRWVLYPETGPCGRRLCDVCRIALFLLHKMANG